MARFTSYLLWARCDFTKASSATSFARSAWPVPPPETEPLIDAPASSQVLTCPARPPCSTPTVSVSRRRAGPIILTLNTRAPPKLRPQTDGGDDAESEDEGDGILAGELPAREPPTGEAPSWAGAISELAETAALRNLTQDASLLGLAEKHAREMAAQMNSQ